MSFVLVMFVCIFDSEFLVVFLSFIRRAEGIAKKFFTQLVLEEQDLLGDAEGWGKVLALIPDQTLRQSLETLMPKCSSSKQRWSTIQSEVSKAVNKVSQCS